MGASQGAAAFILILNSFHTIYKNKIATHQVNLNIPRQETWGILSAAYLGGLAYLLSSPSTIRLIAANFLNGPQLAALSFVQILVASLQRYSPGFVIYPFIEPAVMGWQNGLDKDGAIKASGALSCVTKIDTILITSFIIFVAPVASYALATLGGHSIDARGLILILAASSIIGSTILRSCEIAASFTGSYKTVLLSGLFSLITLALLLMTGKYIGLLGMLLFPLVDIFFRSFIIESETKRRGLSSYIDWRIMGICALGIAISAYASDIIYEPAHLPLLLCVVIAFLSLVLFLIVLWRARPLSKNEASLLRNLQKPTWVDLAIQRATKS